MDDHCDRCGQRVMLAIDGLCRPCFLRLYGGGERHEAPRLFEPAPVPMRGQLGLGVDP